jgi:molybdate transport system ATP-binding protein
MNLDVDISLKRGAFQLSAGFQVLGKRTGVFGPSGSGKSTLMQALAGLVKPDTGHIVLNGRTLFDSRNRVNVSPEKRRIGVVFQHAHLFPHMSVTRNLLYGYTRIPEAERKISPDTLIDVLSIGHLLSRNVAGLSGGERQRVALGRTVLAGPRLILMDEPLTGLDQNLKYQIIPYLRRVLDEFGVPMLFISHSVKEMRLMTDNVIVFSKGGVEEVLPVEDLARRNMAAGDFSYTNMIALKDPRPRNGLWEYTWGGITLVLTEPGKEDQNLFELSAKDIMLFKRHPEASSARNLLSCTVTGTFSVGNRLGVDLSCGGGRLVCQIVPEAAEELDIRPGGTVVAAIKATAFGKVY